MNLDDVAEHLLLPTPVAAPSGNSPEEHLRKKPGRTQVTDLAIIAENGLIETGGLLPTPRATDGTKGGPNQRGSSGDLMLPSAVMMLPTPRATRGGSGTETMYALGAERSDDDRPQGEVLLPTPQAHDSGKGKTPEQVAAMRARGHGVANLNETAENELTLLQTPSVADGLGGHLTRSGSRSNEKLLPGQAKEMATNWGPYEPAIRRWEAVLGRPAPAPTEPNSKGNHRLSPRFTEWMMGVPDGWVTGLITHKGISRNEQLKACGNGVVPAQAAAALRDMLATFEALDVAA